MSKVKKITSLICVIVLIISLLAGCVTNGKDTGETSQTQTQTQTQTQAPVEKEPPFKLSLVATTGVAQFPDADGPLVKKLEELTNTELDFTWITISAQKDRLAAMINTGDMPQMMFLVDEKTNQGFMNALINGVFWEVGPYFKDYNNLKTLDPGILSNVAVDGKIYGVYRARDAARGGVWYRKDWADTLGISMPQTTDDLYEMLKAFSEKDPDRDVENNTIGYYGVGRFFVNEYLNFFISMFTDVYGWGEKDGKASPVFMQDGFMEALKFTNRMYKEKLMNQDFVVAQANTALHKTGVFFGYLSNVQKNTFDKVVVLDPKADYEIIPRLKGERKFAVNPGYGGMFCIPKSKVKTETEVKRILQYLDKVCDEDVQILLHNGIEGIHYNLENGLAVRDEQQQKQWNEKGGAISTLAVLNNKAIQTVRQPLDEKQRLIVQENNKDAIYNIAYPLISDTYAERGAELDKIWQDAMIKFIIGDIDEAGWNAEIENWKSKGGSKIIDEYTNALAKIKKK